MQWPPRAPGPLADDCDQLVPSKIQVSLISEPSKPPNMTSEPPSGAIVWTQRGPGPSFPRVQTPFTFVHVSLRPTPAKSTTRVPPALPSPTLASPSLLTHAPPWQLWLPRHVEHAVPPKPHALNAVPGRHPPAEQQPEHVAESQTHTPAAQVRPLPQVPVAHVPPQPSSAPHAAPAQLGVHPH
jgi:hypothetical protein